MLFRFTIYSYVKVEKAEGDLYVYCQVRFGDIRTGNLTNTVTLRFFEVSNTEFDNYTTRVIAEVSVLLRGWRQQ